MRDKEYEVISIERGWYRIMTELDEDHLFPPEAFEVVCGSVKTHLGRFEEFGPGRGLPSIKEYFEDTPYQRQGKIIWYLKNGRVTYTSAARAQDVITGDLLDIHRSGITDGEYTWPNYLYYYVEKYNLRLSSEFKKKVEI